MRKAWQATGRRMAPAVGMALMVIVLLTVHASAARAQSSEMVSTYMAICLDARRALEARNVDRLETCIVRFDEYADRWAVADLNMQAADTAQAEPTLRGHHLLEPVYIDDLLNRNMDFSQVTFDEHSLRRGAAGGHAGGCVYVAHRVVPAGRTAIYRLRCHGYEELFALSERTVEIGLSITAGNEPIAVTAGGETGLWQSVCTLPDEPDTELLISLHNPTAADVAVIVVSN